MDKKLIERRIQVAIDNGFKLKTKELPIFMEGAGGWHLVEVEFNYRNLIELITSKEFIEAIALYIYNLENSRIDGKIHEIRRLATINKITSDQAIAIRDGKLEEFISLIIKNDNK